MSDINSIVVSGRLTRDAVKKALSTGTEIVEFSIANNTGWGKYEKTTFFNCKSFTKQSISLVPYLVKGKTIAVVGALETEKWVVAGQENSKDVLTVQSITLLHDGGSTGGGVDRQSPSGEVTWKVVDAEEEALF